jgi:hypothetical protein
MTIIKPSDYTGNLDDLKDLPDDYSPYPKSFLGKAIDWLDSKAQLLGGSASTKLTPLHQRIIDAFLPTLDPDHRVILEQQLAQPFFMQFWHKGKVSPFFFDHFRLPPDIRLPVPEFQDRLCKIEMIVDGQK